MANGSEACAINAIILNETTCATQNISAVVGALIPGPPNILPTNYSGIELITASSGRILLRSQQRPREFLASTVPLQPPLISAQIVQGAYGTDNCSGVISIDCSTLSVDSDASSTKFFCDFSLQSFVGTLCGVKITSLSRLGICGTGGEVGLLVNTPYGMIAEPVVPRPSYFLPTLETSFFVNETRFDDTSASWPADDEEIALVDLLNLPVLVWNATCFNGTNIVQNTSSAYVFSPQVQFHSITFNTSDSGGGCIVSAASSRFGVRTSSNVAFIGIATKKPRIDISNQYQYLRGLEPSTFRIIGDFLPRRSLDAGDGLGLIQEDYSITLVWGNHSYSSSNCSLTGQPLETCSGSNLTLPTTGNEILCATTLPTNDSNCALFATIRRGPFTGDEAQIGLLFFVEAPVAPPLAAPVSSPVEPPIRPPEQVFVPSLPPQASPAAAPALPPAAAPAPPPAAPTPQFPPSVPPMYPPSKQATSQAYVKLLISALSAPTSATLSLIRSEIASALGLNATRDIDVFQTYDLQFSKKRAPQETFGLVVDFLTFDSLIIFQNRVIGTPSSERLQIFANAVAGATSFTISVVDLFVAVPPSFPSPVGSPVIIPSPGLTDLPPGIVSNLAAGLGVGPIIGIVVAIVVLIGLIAFSVLFVRARRRQRNLELAARELEEIEAEIEADADPAGKSVDDEESEYFSDELTSGSSYSYTSSSYRSDGPEDERQSESES